MKVKITKEKLKNFLTYESVKIIAVCVAVCLALYVVFNAFTVRPSYGQEIHILYEDCVIKGQDLDSVLISLTTPPKENEEKTTFSYEVLKVGPICIDPNGYTSEYILTKVHSAVFEDDVIVSTEELYKNYVQSNYATDILTYLNDAIAHLVSNGLCDENGVFSKQAVDNYFYTTREGDKRFKTEQQKAEGANYEYARVTALYKQASKLIEVFNKHPELLDEQTFDYYGTVISGKFGLKFSELVGKGENQAKNLFSHVVIEGNESVYTANGLYLFFGENKEETGDLFYECITLLYEIIDRYTPYIS